MSNSTQLWYEVGTQLCVSTVTYPFQYAKFLIQIGHEPLPAYQTKTFFGNPKYVLPNIFQYVKYIRGVDGITGCYRGFGPRITALFVGSVSGPLAVNEIKKQLGEDFSRARASDEPIEAFKRSLLLEVVGTSVTVVVSHPFIVISARMMAEFVGGEQQYNGIFSSIVEIFKNEGLKGFFSGLIPRWIGELAGLIISSSLIFGVKTYIAQDDRANPFTTPTLKFITKTMTYPFTVVSSCMQVNNCGLLAAGPPHMPIYKDWTSCYRHLSKTEGLFRGSSLFMRPCPSPSVRSGSFSTYLF